MNRPREDWGRLASYVVSARLAAGYKDRKQLAAATGVTFRTLGKLETGQRVSADTLAVVAGAVGWTPDSPQLVLSGREPRRVPQQPEPDGHESRRFDSPLLQQIWDDPDLDDGLKEALITVAQAWRRYNRGESGGSERSA